MKNNLRIRSRSISGLVLIFLLLSSCERIEKEDLQSQLVPETASISQQEIQRILNTKVNLESFQVTDDVKFSLPDNYYFQTQLIEKKDFETENIFGKLDFSTKENYSNVELHNSIFVDILYMMNLFMW